MLSQARSFEVVRALGQGTIGLFLLLCLSCSSSRYIGSIGRDQSYANRGYGLLLPLTPHDLLSRWMPLDPNDLPDVPRALLPKARNEPLDLDGDGEKRITEKMPHYDPVLRLLSRTSTSVAMDLQVEIIPKAQKDDSLEALIRERLYGYPESQRAQALASMQTRRHLGGFEMRVLTFPSARVAYVDQRDFVAEERIPRRQLVAVRLIAPKLTEALKLEHERLIQELILSRQGGEHLRQEVW